MRPTSFRRASSNSCARSNASSRARRPLPRLRELVDTPVAPGRSERLPSAVQVATQGVTAALPAQVRAPTDLSSRGALCTALGACGARRDRSQASALAAADARVRSLDETIAAADGRLGALGDLLGDSLSASEYEAVIDAVAGEQLHALLARLTEREREIVRARFGFAGPAETLVEIGQRLGLSAERVRQIEERALAKLRRGC